MLFLKLLNSFSASSSGPLAIFIHLDCFLDFDFFEEVDFFSLLVFSLTSGEFKLVSTIFSSLTAASPILINPYLSNLSDKLVVIAQLCS